MKVGLQYFQKPGAVRSNGRFFLILSDGNSADKTTEKFWNKLKRVAKNGNADLQEQCRKPEKGIYAFPSAYKEIRDGRACSLNS